MQRWSTIGIMAAVLALGARVAPAQAPGGPFSHPLAMEGASYDSPGGWFTPQDCPPYGAAGPQPQTVQELLPDDRGLFYGQDITLAQAMAGSWIRIDYVAYKLQKPGDVLVGARMDTIDPTVPFQARNRDQSPRVEPGTLPIPILGVASDLSSVGDEGLNGARISFGIPTNVGTLEGDAWIIQQATASVIAETEINPLGLGLTQRIIPVIPLLEAGVPSDNTMIAFDDGMRTTLESNIWGTQGNWVYNSVTPEVVPLQIQPMIGVKYVRFQENMLVSGHDQTTLTNPRINSGSENHIFGPQIGLRNELRSKWLTLGVEPKVTFAVNQHRDHVSTVDLFDADAAPFQRTKTQHNDFSAVLDLNLYAKLHLSENFTMHVGYDFMLFSAVSRPFDNVHWNDEGLTTPSAIEVSPQTRSFYTHAIMFGGQYTFY